MADEPSARGHDATLTFAFIVLLLLIGGLAVWYFTWEPPAPMGGMKVAVNVNTAEADVIELLPGVGPGLAQKIVAARQSGGPFADLADLANRVEGIGPKKAAVLRPHLLFELNPQETPADPPAKKSSNSAKPPASAGKAPDLPTPPSP